jgi:hypothetical protein
MKKTYLLPFLAALAVSAFVVPTAAAATEFGDNCVADADTESTPITIFDVTASGDPLPVAAPSAGVITKWKSNLVSAPLSIPQTLKVLRLTGPSTAQIIGEASGSITGGSNTFETRIPVQAGDRLGLYGSSPSGNLFCKTPGVESLLGGFEGGGSVGSSVSFVELPEEARIPVSAVLEPDADNDGFGDETQDKCPQSVAVQVACPAVTLSATGAAKKELASIAVTANSQATVTVKGKVKLGKGKSAKLSGGTQIVAPGTLAKFTLLFPQKLRAALKALSTKQSLTLKVTVSAPNITGPPSTKTLKLHLKGQAKPKSHSHKKGA